jgi:hypothetical protein
MQDWLNAVLPLAGGVIGAALTFWFTRAAERDKHIDSLRSQAYVDYLRALAESAHRPASVDPVGVRRNLADAKARHAVYGSAKVFAALARLEGSGAVVVDRTRPEDFLALVAAMRLGDPVTNQDLKTVLIGTDATRT